MPRLAFTITFATLLLALPGMPPTASGATSATVTPPFKAASLVALDRAIATAISEKKMPGGELWLEHKSQIYHKVYGHQALVPKPVAIEKNTLYDAASLTKVIATTTAILRLVEQGKIDLDAPVARLLPAFAQHHKEAVTVRQLMTHTSGLRAGLPRDPPWTGAEVAITRACAEELRHAPGSTVLYSDINFILLGELVRVASGKPLDVFAADEIFGPLKMKDTGFRPAAAQLTRVAPTQIVNGELLHGVVHDPTARAMGGVAGHAGLFTTAADLARFSRMLLAGGELEGIRILSTASVAEMTRSQLDGSDRRGLGWDIDSRYSGARGTWFPAGNSYGHTGWTGTSLWVDPGANAFVIFLSNRVHPDGTGDVTPLRRVIGTLAAEAIGRDIGATRNGIDVLVREDFAPLRGLKIGLITNHSGRDRQGRLTIDLLHDAPEVNLVALFSPEHGIRGVADEKVGDTIDSRTKLPVYSLYGDTPKRTPEMSPAEFDRAVISSRAPKAAQLRELDALVFDIQDIGARFYTYSATLGVALEAAAREKKKIFVLDRVNPITGTCVEGPIQTRAPSFIGYHSIPVRHGMTLGELARLFNSELKIGADLVVIRCENYTRDQWFDDTGLPWVNPSPSMRSLTAATLYTGFCLLESTSISMGRGTDRPFEQVGAPFINGEQLARELNAANLPGVRFEAVQFTPTMTYYPGPASTLKYREQPCGGVRAVLTDRNTCSAVDIGIELALVLHRLHPGEFKVKEMGRLLGDDETLQAIEAGESRAAIKARWAKGLRAFEERRQSALLY